MIDKCKTVIDLDVLIRWVSRFDAARQIDQTSVGTWSRLTYKYTYDISRSRAIVTVLYMDSSALIFLALQ